MWDPAGGARPGQFPDHDEKNFEPSFQEQDGGETFIQPAEHGFRLGRNLFYHSVIGIGQEYSR
jgi:hypothetical protein